MKGNHYALVLSPKAFNKLTGLIYACPISQGKASAARGMLATYLVSVRSTQGNIHCHQLSGLTGKSEKPAFKERVPDFVLDDVLARIRAVLFN